MASTRPSADAPARAGAPAREIALVGMLIALACALALAESAFMPPLPVPGVRLGLANLAVVLALAWAGPRAALGVSLGRVVLTGLLAGGLGGPAFLLALTGALASWLVMAVMWRAGGTFSVVGWSSAGSVAHVAAQLIVASLLTGSAAVLSLAPLSVTLALVSGLAVGVAARVLLSRVPLAVVSGVRNGRERGATNARAEGRTA